MALAISTTSSTSYSTDIVNAIYPARVDNMPYEAFTPTTRTSYFQLVGTGGTTANYLWSVVSGSLPPGLSLSSDGKISGTATTEGSYTFTVELAYSTNAYSSVTKQLTMEAKPYRGKSIIDANYFITIHWGMFTHPRLYGKSQIAAFEARVASVNFTTWAQQIKALGFRGVIFTCIWQDSVRNWPSTTPTKFELKTTRNIAKEFCDACHSEGLLFGTYFPPDYLNSNRPGEGPATEQSFLDTPNPPDGTPVNYTWGPMNTGLITELARDIGVDLFWIDVGGAPELYSFVDSNWLYWTDVIKVIRAYNDSCCVGINGGIKANSIVPGGIPVRYPDTDFVITEGYPGSLSPETVDIGLPTIVEKKYAVTADIMLAKTWAFGEFTANEGYKDPAAVVERMKENKLRGAASFIAIPVQGADGNVIHEAYTNAVSIISDYMKSDLGYSAEAVITVSGNTATISCPANGRVYYTIDGSDVKSTSLVYIRPIPVTKNMVVKARVMESGKPIGIQAEKRVTSFASTAAKTLITSAISGESNRTDSNGNYRGMRIIVGPAPLILRKIGRKGTCTAPKKFLIRRQYDNYPIYWGTLMPSDEVIDGYQYAKVPDKILEKGVTYRVFFKEDVIDNYASSTFGSIPSFRDLRISKAAQASALGETAPFTPDGYGQYINLMYDVVEAERSRDLALGKPCIFRTLQGAALGPSSTAFEENVVDGIFESIGKAGGAYAYETVIDLLSIYELSEIYLRFATTGFATSFEIWVSLDDTTQTMRKIVSKSSNTTRNFNFKFQPIPARYIHVKALAPYGPNQLGGQSTINILSAYRRE